MARSRRSNSLPDVTPKPKGKPRGRRLDYKKEGLVKANTVCPKCSAAKGAKCVTFGGRSMGFSHADRYKRYEAVVLMPHESILNDEVVMGIAHPMWQEAVASVALDRDPDGGTQSVDGPVEVIPRQRSVEGAAVELPFPNETNLHRTVHAALGMTVEEAVRRSEKIQNAMGGLWIIHNINGLDFLIKRIAEMIVDREDWTKDWE